MNGDRLTILQGDCVEKLNTLASESVHCCVTSPPYWGLRDYGVAGQIGLEKSPEEYVAKMVEVFREVRRVLRGDGTLWLNLGDSYATNVHTGDWGLSANDTPRNTPGPRIPPGLKPKDLCGIPWRVAFALQADGWYLRSDIIWHKPNPMPESVTDRPTKAHEYLFLLAKSERYFYDSEAIAEPSECLRLRGSGPMVQPGTGRNDTDRNGDYRNADNRKPFARGQVDNRGNGHDRGGGSERSNGVRPAELRNKRTVWTIPTFSYPDSHFATFPPDLVKPCILAGTSAKGCCPQCGAPWERIVQRIGGSIGHSWHDHSVDLEQGQRITDSTAKGSIARCKDEKGEEYQVKTLGWQPTCDCAESSTVPCVVVDPFAGSFTTCQVALELGRHAIGIELNPQYVELGRKRCDVTPGLPLA